MKSFYESLIKKNYLDENQVSIGLQIVKKLPKSVARRCSVKKVFLKISQNSQENTCARAFFNNVVDIDLQLYYKKDSGTGVFL